MALNLAFFRLFVSGRESAFFDLVDDGLKEDLHPLDPDIIEAGNSAKDRS
jgi:hypothetical protein